MIGIPWSQSLSKEAIEDIERRYLAGETLQSIADRYGRSRERIRQIAQKELGHPGRCPWNAPFKNGERPR